MKTARAVVIDDDPKEAQSLLKALGSVGIGCIYIPGDNPDLLPKNQCHGIRVVFLDLNLINQGESKQYVPYAVKVLENCVAFSGRSVGIIAWTRHSEDMAILQDELNKKKLEPAFLLPIRDKVTLVERGDAGASEILRQISVMFGQFPALSALFGWEQAIHEAVTATTDALLGQNATEKDLTSALAAIAKAHADEKITSPEGAIHSLDAGLISVLIDSVEERAVFSEGPSPDYAKLVLSRIGELRKTPLSELQKDHLNTVLLTSGSQVNCPGSVYLAWTGGLPTIAAPEKSKALIFELYFPHWKDKNVDDWKAFRAKIGDAAIPFLLEITPACDHAAGKSEAARLLAGLLIRLDDKVRRDEVWLPAESRSFAKEIEPIYLDIPEPKVSGSFKAVVRPRRFLSANLDEIVKQKPAFRFRHPVVADIRAWFASHAARPGYVSVS